MAGCACAVLSMTTTGVASLGGAYLAALRLLPEVAWRLRAERNADPDETRQRLLWLAPILEVLLAAT